jgi:hypothetical protein
MQDCRTPYWQGQEESFGTVVELTFGYSITDSFDDDYLTMMQDSVSQSSREGGIVVERFSPLVRRSVGGNDH